MTLEQLRIFLAVAEREHLTRAAESLNLTQSAVSSAIATLEARYGLALFDRIGRGLALTAAGRRFMGDARAVLARAREAETLLHELAGAATGTLTLTVSQTIGNDWIAPRLAAFHRAVPGVQVSLSIGNTEQAVKAVLTRESECAVVEGFCDDPRLEITLLPGDSMMLILPPAHPFAHLKALEREHFEALRFVTREPGSGTRALLEEHLARFGLTLSQERQVMVLASNEAVRGAVEAGLGVALLSHLTVKQSCDAGRVIGRDIGLAPRPFRLLRQKGASDSRTLTQWRKACLETV